MDHESEMDPDIYNFLNGKNFKSFSLIHCFAPSQKSFGNFIIFFDEEVYIDLSEFFTDYLGFEYYLFEEIANLLGVNQINLNDASFETVNHFCYETKKEAFHSFLSRMKDFSFETNNGDIIDLKKILYFSKNKVITEII